MEDLARLSFKRKPVYVGVDDQRTEATREGLEQGYCVVPSEQRFLLLFTFLKRNAAKKVRLQLGPAREWRLAHIQASCLARSWRPHLGTPAVRAEAGPQFKLCSCWLQLWAHSSLNLVCLPGVAAAERSDDARMPESGLQA